MPAAGGRLPAVGPLERDRLAGDDRRRVAVQLAVLVHHPGHHLGVRVDVGRHDVALRAEHLLDLVHERARDRLELVRRELVGRAVDPALRAAERNADDRGLPRHQRRERAGLVEVDLGVVADAALVRPARAVVLDAEAREDVQAPVGEPDRDLDLDLAVGRGQDVAHVVLDPQPVGRDPEVVQDDLVVGELGAALALDPRARIGAVAGLGARRLRGRGPVCLVVHPRGLLGKSADPRTPAASPPGPFTRA